MRLKQKSALFILGSFFAFGVTAFAFFNYYLLREFTDLENQQATRNIARLSEALEQEIKTLIERTRDWAVWDDAYSFVTDHNADFIESNLSYEAVKSIQFDHILFLTAPNKISYAIQVDFDSGKVGELSDSTRSKLVDSGVFAPILSGSSPGGGIVEIDGYTYLAAASAITDSAETKEPNGILVFTRKLSDDIIERIGKQTRLNVTRVTTPSASIKRSPKPKQNLDPTSAFALEKIERSDRQLVGYLSVYDLFGKEVFSLVTPMSREIFFQGLRFRNYVAGGLGILGFITALVVILLTHKLVISRVSKIGSELGFIAQERVFAERVNVLGQDELSDLATAINKTLEALDLAQRESSDARNLAESANAAKSAFIAKVSHELRTPIASITGMNRMVLKRDLSKPVRDLISTADKSAWDLLDILNEILDYSKAESGNLTTESIAFNLRDVLNDAFTITTGRLADKESVELLCDIPAEVPNVVIGDPTKLKQILVNLMGNSVKFTQQGHVLLSVAQAPGGLSLKISDTGVGIPPEKLNSIFEPFKQADSSVTRNYQGTGLGLAIVKQFVDVLGGTVAVESQPGKGTTFSVTLPYAAVMSSPRDQQSGASNNPNTLLVGPTCTALEILRNNLRSYNCRVTQFASGAEINTSALNEAIAQNDLLVISEEASRDSSILGALSSADIMKSKTIVILAKSSSVELRESLHHLGFKCILRTPALPGDILSCYAAKMDSSTAHETKTQNPTLLFSRKLHVLVADDMPTNRIILEDLLTEAGHSVTCVGDGKALVEYIKNSISSGNSSEQVDIVITDITMPIMDGYEATRAVRSFEQKGGAKQAIPIIAVTAHALRDEKERMKAAGISGIVSKPIKPEDLVAEFNRLLV